MMKKYKWSLLLGSLLSLSPILIGLLLWNQLPAKLPTHFSTGNTPDGWSSKAITVFGLPLFMFAMMWFCFLFTHVDPKRQNISPKLIRALVWFMAALSPIVVCSSYAIALGINVNITLLTYLIIGLMLLVIGNYLAKTKQNYSAGIRIPWTLSSEENWNRTHRRSRCYREKAGRQPWHKDRLSNPYRISSACLQDRHSGHVPADVYGKR